MIKRRSRSSSWRMLSKTACLNSAFVAVSPYKFGQLNNCFFFTGWGGFFSSRFSLAVCPVHNSSHVMGVSLFGYRREIERKADMFGRSPTRPNTKRLRRSRAKTPATCPMRGTVGGCLARCLKAGVEACHSNPFPPGFGFPYVFP